jgi:hypothetical protein
VIGYGAVRAADGRSARRTGRTVQFATVVSAEFKHWLKTQAAARGKSMAALLDDMGAGAIGLIGSCERPRAFDRERFFSMKRPSLRL